MKKWTVKAVEGADFDITGNTLLEAITANLKRIANQAQLGNAAGYKLISATANYNSSILGGHGGVELKIVHVGLPLALKNSKIDAPSTKLIWIYANPDDLPDSKKFI